MYFKVPFVPIILAPQQKLMDIAPIKVISSDERKTAHSGKDIRFLSVLTYSPSTMKIPFLQKKNSQITPG
jgi:hypothetical protein